MRLGKFQEICYKFLFMLVVFALMSEIFYGQPELARNLCWALGFTLFSAIRDELEPATQRIVNLVVYGIALVLVPIAIFYSVNTTGEYVALVLLLLYGAYRFFEEYVIKQP